MPSAELLIHNSLVFGAAVVLVLVAAFALSRLLARLDRLLRRGVEPSASPRPGWIARLSRALVLATTLACLLLLGAAVVCSGYEIDVALSLGGWAEAMLNRDPRETAAAAAWLLAVVAGAPLVYLLLRGVLGAAFEGVAGLPSFARRKEQLDLLQERLRGALRWILLAAALLVVSRFVAPPDSVREALSALLVVAGAVAVARALAAGAHLAVDIGVDLSEVLVARRGPARYFSRLQGLAGVTKRTLDYFIYVGAATLVGEQLTPGTSLSAAGLAAIRVIAILYFSRVLIAISEIAVSELFAARDAELSEAEQQQRRTLVPVANSVLRYAIYIVAAAMVLGELGVDTTPLLAAAGLLGIAVGLGAQAIVGDLVSGFFILFESLFLVGHRVQIGEVVGVVEEIGVRVTKIRDEAGVVHCVPNGEIRSVSSHSQRFVNAVVDFGVAYGEDLPRVFAALEERFAAARAKYDEILGETEIAIEELREAAIWIRTKTPVKPGRDEDMSEALRFEVVAALAAAVVAPPHARQVVELRATHRGAPTLGDAAAATASA